MSWWKCTNCSYTFQSSKPPNQCPSCKQNCAFTDITCYVPDCGGPAHKDPRL